MQNQTFCAALVAEHGVIHIVPASPEQINRAAQGKLVRVKGTPCNSTYAAELKPQIDVRETYYDVSQFDWCDKCTEKWKALRTQYRDEKAEQKRSTLAERVVEKAQTFLDRRISHADGAHSLEEALLKLEPILVRRQEDFSLDVYLKNWAMEQYSQYVLATKKPEPYTSEFLAGSLDKMFTYLLKYLDQKHGKKARLMFDEATKNLIMTEFKKSLAKS